MNCVSAQAFVVVWCVPAAAAAATTHTAVAAQHYVDSVCYIVDLKCH